MENPFELDTGPLPPQDVPATRRAQFAQANASLALEGMTVDAGDLAIQEAVATGALTPDEAVAMCLERAREAAQ